MSLIRSGRVRAAASVVASAALVLAMSAAMPATAAPAHGSSFGDPPVIDVNITTDGGFTLPASVRPGLVTFRVTTPETTYHGFQGFRTKNGATKDQVVADLVEGLSGDPVRAAAGASGLLVHATLIGGVVPGAFGAISSTVLMTPGTYYFFDLNDIFIEGQVPRVHTMEVRGPIQGLRVPHIDAVALLESHEHDGEDMHSIAIQGDLPANGTFLVVNTADEVHELVFRQVIPGTTDEYLTTYFDAVRNGTPRPPRPWVDIQHGLQAISPGVFAFVKIELPPAPYAALCLVPSADIGIGHNLMGMFKIVNLH
jgi:hypothetical protein